MKPIRKKRTYELVVDRLKQLLAGENYRPGDRLPTERELSLALNVSRATVREALLVLERSGLVEICPGRGIVVCQFDQQVNEPIVSLLQREGGNVLNLLEFRKGIEAEAANLAAMRNNPRREQKLREAYAALEKAVNQENLGAEEDNNFHRVVAENTGNHLFGLVMDTIADLLKDAQSKTRAETMRRPGGPQTVLREHKAVLDAIVDGDGRRAREAMLGHLDNVAEKILKVLE